jgi:hypothetical protein
MEVGLSSLAGRPGNRCARQSDAAGKNEKQVRRAPRRINGSTAVQAHRHDVRAAHALGFGVTRGVRVLGVERQVRGDEQVVDLLKQRKNEAHLRLLTM